MPIGWWTNLQGHDLQEEEKRREEFKKEKFGRRWKFFEERGEKKGDRKRAEMKREGEKKLITTRKITG